MFYKQSFKGPLAGLKKMKKYTHNILSFPGWNGPAKTTDLNCFNTCLLLRNQAPQSPALLLGNRKCWKSSFLNYPSEFVLLTAIANLTAVQKNTPCFQQHLIPPHDRTLYAANLAHSHAEYFFSYTGLLHARESFGFSFFLSFFTQEK